MDAGATTRNPPVALFLFAHQDDEFGVFHRIEQCVRAGLRVHCAYLTDGAYKRATPQRRNRESLAVLGRLGVRAQDVAFAGQQAGIGDGALPERLQDAQRWLQEWLTRFPDIDSIHVPAWEGGHQDHDALHALVVRLAHARGLLDKVWQFPLYTGYGCRHPMFSVLKPLDANGTAAAVPMTLRERVRYLRLCLAYPSQLNAWVWLFPPVAWHYCRRGVQQLQRVSLGRIGQAPHEGELYYERRGFYTWRGMRERLGATEKRGTVP